MLSTAGAPGDLGSSQWVRAVSSCVLSTPRMAQYSAGGWGKALHPQTRALESEDHLICGPVCQNQAENGVPSTEGGSWAPLFLPNQRDTALLWDVSEAQGSPASRSSEAAPSFGHTAPRLPQGLSHCDKPQLGTLVYAESSGCGYNPQTEQIRNAAGPCG